MRLKPYEIVIFVVSTFLAIFVGYKMVTIRPPEKEAEATPQKVVGIGEQSLNPALLDKNFPYQYDSFVKTKIDYGKTEYGGSTPYNKLERFPAMKRLWAGYAFSIDHNEDRGHHFAAIDQAETQRVKMVNQPGACANCHAAESPRLIEEMGWKKFNHTPYNELQPHLKTGTSCADCHDPKTMALRITRPAFIHAMKEAGVDLTTASRQDMRSYVCAQCHAEYYFKGPDRELTFPWSKGRTVEDIEKHYEAYDFKDWTHKETGAPMLKMQHPEFELWGTGIHARSGVSCADCHMPHVAQGSVKASDHWVRSPLHNLKHSCQACHNRPAEELKDRVLNIQHKTDELLTQSQQALLSAMDAIVAARQAGAGDDDLKEALHLHRRGQMRWDFISSENSTGFHSPQEAARILADSIDYARQAEIAALKACQYL